MAVTGLGAARLAVRPPPPLPRPPSPSASAPAAAADRRRRPSPRPPAPPPPRRRRRRRLPPRPRPPRRRLAGALAVSAVRRRRSSAALGCRRRARVADLGAAHERLLGRLGRLGLALEDPLGQLLGVAVAGRAPAPTGGGGRRAGARGPATPPLWLVRRVPVAPARSGGAAASAPRSSPALVGGSVGAPPAGCGCGRLVNPAGGDWSTGVAVGRVGRRPSRRSRLGGAGRCRRGAAGASRRRAGGLGVVGDRVGHGEVPFS